MEGGEVAGGGEASGGGDVASSTTTATEGPSLDVNFTSRAELRVGSSAELILLTASFAAAASANVTLDSTVTELAVALSVTSDASTPRKVARLLWYPVESKSFRSPASVASHVSMYDLVAPGVRGGMGGVWGAGGGAGESLKATALPPGSPAKVTWRRSPPVGPCMRVRSRRASPIVIALTSSDVGSGHAAKYWMPDLGYSVCQQGGGGGWSGRGGGS